MTNESGENRQYRSFWHEVGHEFPDLAGARSTDYYAETEQLLFETYAPDLRGLKVFKTDLWDEAKNTRILTWAAERGARPFGIDISPPIARQAGASFPESEPLAGVVSDVRRIPFADGSFDVVYSMGTVEHFDETEEAIAEIFRVLKPGGLALLGVPNKLDPFLRPLLVAVLWRLGLYGYGFEKSYTHGQLNRMCRQAGFEVEDRTGILFIPGWLRMLDLLLHTRAPALARLSGLLVRPFAWAYRRFPRLRRHGYLIVAVARRPASVQAAVA